MHVLQPLVPLPHVAQLLPPAALHPGLDFPHKGFTSSGDKRLAQPHVGNGSQTRLPGVRDLLMPQSVVSEPRFDPDRRHFSAQDKLLRTTASLAFSPILLPARAESQPSGSTLSAPKHNAPDFSRRWPGEDVEKSGAPQFLPQPGPQSTPPGHVHLTPPAVRSQATGFPFARPTTTPPRPSVNSFERFGNSPDIPAAIGSAEGGNPNSPSADTWASTSSRQEWGMTKAGKPRKRLALACLNCRQKKIRCHPNPRTMRCNHCERTGSYCRFEGG